MLSLKQAQEPFVLKNFTQLMTRGGGDCAFHAVLGQWNGHEVACEEIEERRKILKAALQTQPLDSVIEPLLQVAIRELVMSDKNLNEFHSVKTLRKQYQLFLSSEEMVGQNLWQTFESRLTDNGKSA